MALTELETTLCRAIELRREQLWRELAEHVAIRTGRRFAPGLERYRRILLERLKKLGALVSLREGLPRPEWIDPPNAARGESEPQPIAIAARGARGDSPRILIAGHLDTVHDPRGPFRSLRKSEDGVTATGPGAADMKGGILIALTALEVLHELDMPLNWTFVLNADEETGSFESEAVLRELAAIHDVGLVVEPALADGSLAIERMGSGQFMFEVFGRSAHVGREFEKGISAVTKLGEILVALGKLADPSRGRIVNVGPIVGGSVTNAVPDHAACWGNVRYRNRETGEALMRELDALATEERDRLPRVVVHRHLNRPAKPLTQDVEALANTAREAVEDLGQQLPFAKTGGVCDGNILQDAGLPTIDTLGVRGGNLHRHDEFIEIASLVERAQLFAIIVTRLSRPH